VHHTQGYIYCICDTRGNTLRTSLVLVCVCVCVGCVSASKSGQYVSENGSHLCVYARTESLARGYKECCGVVRRGASHDEWHSCMHVYAMIAFSLTLIHIILSLTHTRTLSLSLLPTLSLRNTHILVYTALSLCSQVNKEHLHNKESKVPGTPSCTVNAWATALSPCSPCS
jgi:hypothetical protein